MYVPQGVRIRGTQTQWTGKIASQVITKQYFISMSQSLFSQNIMSHFLLEKLHSRRVADLYYWHGFISTEFGYLVNLWHLEASV